MTDEIDPNELMVDIAETEALLRFQEEPFRPISEYDGTTWAILSDDTDWMFGCRHNGRWCSMFDGEYYPREGFEPTQFKIVPGELLVAYAH